MSRKSVPDSVPVVLHFEAALHVVAITMAVPMSPLGQSITINDACVMYMTPCKQEADLNIICMDMLTIWHRHGDCHHMQGRLEIKDDRHAIWNALTAHFDNLSPYMTLV